MFLNDSTFNMRYQGKVFMYESNTLKGSIRGFFSPGSVGAPKGKMNIIEQK